MDQSGIRGSGENQDFSKREERYPCLFPGMLRVLFPEKSFVPINLAVRIANISSGGSLVEIHEGNIEDSYSSFEGCYFELRIATGDVPLMYGRVVRSDMEEDYCMLGLRFHKAYPEVIGQLVHEDIPVGRNGVEPLETPILNPFSPMSDEPIVYIIGKAPGATEIIVTADDEERSRIPVQGDDFTVKLELAQEDFNEFRLVSTDGTRESHALPVIVAWVPLPENDFHFHVETVSDINGHHVLNMEYMGSPKASGDMLRNFAELTPNGKHTRISLRLTALDPFEPKAIKNLKQESERIRQQSVVEEE